MKRTKTYADKVNELLAKQNGEESSDESAGEQEEPRVTEFLDEEYELPQKQSTDFRKRNVKLLSEQSVKYKGKVTSRKELEDESEQDSEGTESDEAEAAEAFKSFSSQLKQISNGDKASEEDDDDDEEEEEQDSDELNEEEEENDGNDDDEIESGEEEEDHFDDDDENNDDDDEDQQIVSETNRQKEIQKGACVQNQLRIWEKLLEMRIQSQKMLTKANQLPAPEKFQAIEDVDALKTETVQNVSNLLNKLLDLQQALSQQYPEMKTSQKRVSQSVSNEEPPSKRFGLELQQHFKTFSKYRNEVLLKWDDRTKVMTPGAGKRKSAQEDYNVLKKIDFVLNNRPALIKRSQTLKSNSNETEAAPVLTHIYDDSDFYHHQLRELIEYKSNTSSSMAEVTKQYVELQKLRQKMKKKVDTRASKGRKIRYVVHNKLVNFMAPEDTSSWTAESKDELYKSLFVA